MYSHVFARALSARQRLLARLKTVLQTSNAERKGGLDLLSGGLDEAGLPLDDDDLVDTVTNRVYDVSHGAMGSSSTADTTAPECPDIVYLHLLVALSQILAV